MHLLLNVVNNYCKSERMTLHSLETEFIKSQLYPNYASNFYVFENKEENHIKNGVTKTYSRTARVDKK